MKKIIFIALLLLIDFFAVRLPIKAQVKDSDVGVVAARKARDRADVEELQKMVAQAKQEAAGRNSFEAYLRLALYQSWLCEALESREQNEKLFKQAAEEGVAAAEKAVELNPQSSEAHQLLGDLLNQLIPHVFGGGMRYGKRATDAMDKALELDPKNVSAYVSRAISYYYTPDSFGGSKTRAFELLKQAVGIDPQEDSPHIWLALFYMDANRKEEALAEILLARKANPDRVFTNYVYRQITGNQDGKRAPEAPVKKSSGTKTN
ncbi:MAG TPA: tetratricopeptide repeat protein [Pyrinomonadaceae bacterium]|nr:tetratricopeptide repeat protein [Pyrinomonadaceae bacterium]